MEINIQNIDTKSFTSQSDSLEFISIDEARKKLKLRAETVKKLILNGELHAVKLNKRYKIPLQSVKNYIESISHYEKRKYDTIDSPTATKINVTSINEIIDNLKNKYSTI